ncbi:hypothetical protein FA15DRAFT_672549 [Coprinopsis marcescibilis]|uniref:Uncharacterized protein n=1 Tax=Coprinopsis marcescibilis TaxID=230819 RepID=A0A5C3KMA9_COPMA|nr:hypothetical protein FA15DRAFT_672549 [Coprinopsis marcescibilis]
MKNTPRNPNGELNAKGRAEKRIDSIKRKVKQETEKNKEKRNSKSIMSTTHRMDAENTERR